MQKVPNNTIHIVTQNIYITIPKGRHGNIGNTGPKQD